MQSVAETAGIFIDTVHQSVSRRPFTVTGHGNSVALYIQMQIQIQILMDCGMVLICTDKSVLH